VKEDVHLSALKSANPSTIWSSASEIPAKRQFRREITSIPSSPPLKRAVPAAKVAFCSPDREHLREVLQSGGAADIDLQEGTNSLPLFIPILTSFLVLNLQHENIEFFPIPTRPLSDILKNPEYHAFRLDTEAGHSGQLAVQTDPEKRLGTGGFKTAHPGFLTLLSAPGTTLCSRQRQKVAVKRFFYKKYPPGGNAEMMDFGFGRYTIADELPKLFREANVLYWASSLLTFAYEYIDHCISASSDPPPFYIPRLRFVEAGLVLSYHQAQPTGGPGPGQKSKPLSPRAAFLVEELISDTFLKYIHNMDCNPLLDPDEAGYRIAEFLACTQHIQYAKTGGLAFISDYQGTHAAYVTRTLYIDAQ
jgi:hypothetical protein